MCAQTDKGGKGSFRKLGIRGDPEITEKIRKLRRRT